MTPKQRKKRFRRYLILFWSIILGGLIGVFLLFYSIAEGAFGKLPTFEQLENPDNYLASEVYTADSVLIGKYYQENRTYTSYANLSPHLINALIATEDIRFYDHSGIDFKGTMAVPFYLMMGKMRGASTITQQLAKNLFKRKDFDSFFDIVITKFKEWITAVKIERRYTKQEILTMYFNTVPFGSNAFGIESAAHTFFNTKPDSLTVPQAATLVGMLKGTTLYNPHRNPERSKQRRNIVIGQMAKYEKIDPEKADSLQKLPIKLDYNPTDHIKGLAPYFRQQLRLELQQWCRKHLKPDSTPYNLYRDGLKIYTTLNSKLQHYAESAIDSHLKYLQTKFYEHWEDRNLFEHVSENVVQKAVKKSYRYRKLKSQGVSKDSIKKIFNTPTKMSIFTWQGNKDTVMTPLDSIKYHLMIVQAGFMAMDPQTGHVKAWVGGVDFKHFKYDHVNINAKRQVGSTFKPFVYAVAMMNRISPCKQLPNMPITFEEYDDWTPKNATGEVGGMVTLQDGLAHSMNIITAQLMKQLGKNSPELVIDLARRVGITSPIPPVPAICLGTPDISVYELVGAYGTFANQGVWVKPTYLSRIEDQNGNVIQEFSTQKQEALDEKTAYLMVKMLEHVVNDPKGTAARLRGMYNFPYSLEIIGKTGTTQDHSDGWFIGSTPELVTGIWTGWEYRSIHFRTLEHGQGARMAMPIWALFMKQVLNDNTLHYSKEAKFKKPSEPLNVELDCEEYEQKTNQGLDFTSSF